MSRKFDLPLILALVLCAAVAAPVVWLIGSGVVYQREHHQFTHALSVATVYADENNCMKATTEEGAVRVGHYNTYTLFALFTEEKFKPRSHAPDGTTWLYDTDAFNIQSLLRPCALSENEPWE